MYLLEKIIKKIIKICATVPEGIVATKVPEGTVATTVWTITRIWWGSNPWPDNGLGLKVLGLTTTDHLKWWDILIDILYKLLKDIKFQIL